MTYSIDTLGVQASFIHFVNTNSDELGYIALVQAASIGIVDEANAEHEITAVSNEVIGV